ncbi:hypothetical protein L1987_09648 [Smallanthus sonchifolius]|uniref:Uncharacterized protein n=1 Tax=Smallanthus sonchifolius TaxID=185202 RepID=A0ACB9JPZ0_9ASTR|nr:hypothetical protein L1987_09648 [Smallanthus sonchifolius]
MDSGIHPNSQTEGIAAEVSMVLDPTGLGNANSTDTTSNSMPDMNMEEVENLNPNSSGDKQAQSENEENHRTEDDRIDIEQEVQDTMEVGNLIGLNLHKFQNEVRNSSRGEGFQSVYQ